MNTQLAIEQAAAKLSEQLQADLREIGDKVVDDRGVAHYTLADAIREGSSVSDQAYAWSGPQGELCALSAACAAIKARGL